jgi:hypothetical protein
MRAKISNYDEKLRAKEKSLVVHIPLPLRKTKSWHYRCTTKLLFKPSFGLLSKIPSDQRRFPDRAVTALWGDSLQTRGVEQLQQGSGVYMIDTNLLADVLSGEELSEIEKASLAFLQNLPSGWRSFVCLNLAGLNLDD